MVVKGSKRTKKNWRKLDSTLYEEKVKNYNSQLFTGGLVKEKSDADLFFTNVSKKGKSLKRVHPLKRPLRCLEVLENKSLVNVGGESSGEVKIPKSSRKMSTIVTKHDSQDYNKIISNTLRFRDIWLLDAEPELKMEKEERVPECVPHPGTSYNPCVNHHQDLLRSAHSVVQRDEEENERAQQIFNDGFAIPSDELERREREMMMSGLGETPLRPLIEATDEMRTSHRRERKTRAQINQKKRNIIKERKRARAVLAAKREKQVGNIAEISRQLDMEGERVKEKKRERLEKRKQFRTKRVGRGKFVEPLPLDLKLSDELPSSLMSLAPEGSLLRDHFVGFQRRNMICPPQKTRRRGRKKCKDVFRRNLRYL